MEASSGGEPPVPSDGDLVRAARGGDARAFERLVRRYQGLALARAFGVLRNRNDAEDAAQDAFIRAFRFLGQLKDPEAFGPWLLRAVANVASRAARRRSRHAMELLDSDKPDRREPHSDVLEAVAALPEGYQQVVHLHYSQGFSCSEIARLLGLRVGSVTSRLTRARQMLRKALSEDEEKR